MIKDESRIVRISYDEKLTELDKMILSSYGTYKNFAKRINMPETTLQTIRKSPMRNMRLYNSIKIAKGLHMSLQEFIDLTQKMGLF